MISRLFKTLPEEQTWCVCSVGSYTVSAAVVRIYHRPGSVTKPVVLFSCEQVIPLYYEDNLEALENFVFDATHTVLEKCRSYHGNFDKLVCTIGEPWSSAFPRSIHIEKTNAFKVINDTVDDAIIRETRLFEQEILRDFGDGEPLGTIGVSKPIIDINGYRVSNYQNVTAKTLDVHLVFSLAPVYFVEELISIFGDVFHRTDVFISSLDIARPLLISQERTTAILDFGGISSTLSIIHHGHSVFQTRIEEGLSNIENSIREQFAIPRSQVASVMQFANDEQILRNQQDVYYRRIQVAYEAFGQSLRNTVVQIKTQTGSLPNHLVVIGIPEWLPVFDTFISSDTETSVQFLPEGFFDEQLVLPKQLSTQNIHLILSIIQATKNF